MERAEKSVKFSGDHYQIAVSWKEEMLQLPDSFRIALNRLENLERRLKKSPQTATAYSEVIAKHLEKGYDRKLDEIPERNEAKWYLPHFTVVKANRQTTKVRVVLTLLPDTMEFV